MSKLVEQILKADPARIKQYREENECSLSEALSVIKYNQIEDAIDEAASIGELKLILHEMLRRWK